MIKLLSIAFSLVTVAYLSSDYLNVEQQSGESASITHETIALKPPKLTEELLGIEAHWESEKKARLAKQKAPKAKVTKPRDNNKKLQLGDQAYVLYGIFANPSQPFVLLKDESGKMIKLKQGESLNKETKLVGLQSNNIAFERNSERIEFKLFERKQ